jgi:hypothetical protein
MHVNQGTAMKSFLKENVGPFDQWARYAGGFVLLFLAGAGIIGPWGYIGIVPLATAMLRYCPLYHALGIRTARAGAHKAR